MTISEKPAEGVAALGNTQDHVTAIVTAFVSKNIVAKEELPDLISRVRDAITGGSQAEAPQKASPAEIKKSITPDALISFLDGRPYKTLRRHLTCAGLTFDEYKARYGLPKDYPSVAASYSEKRSQLAISLGLGQQRRKPAA